MMRRAISWFGLLTVSVLLLGCSTSPGIEPGVPKDLNEGKASDPMAGVKMLPNPSPKPVFNDPMKPNGGAAKTSPAAK